MEQSNFLAERQSLEWSTTKHTSSEHTDVMYPIAHFVFEVAKLPQTGPIKNGKKVLNLSYGEPTRENGFIIPESMTNAVVEVAKSGDKNGYGPQMGYIEAREAIVDQYARPPEFTFTANDVYLTFGCHGALQTSISVLCNKGENLLVPRPNFPIVKAICDSLGIEIRYYDLIADKGWEADLEMMRSLIDSKTKAILVTNPSNPCSVVFTKDH